MKKKILAIILSSIIALSLPTAMIAEAYDILPVDVGNYHRYNNKKKSSSSRSRSRSSSRSSSRSRSSSSSKNKIKTMINIIAPTVITISSGLERSIEDFELFETLPE